MRTTDPTTRDQLAYARLIIREALCHGGVGWLDYDRAFRQQATVDPSLRWNTLLPGLLASTMLGCGTGQGALFCTLCRDVDHTRAQCALLCMHPPTTQTPTTTSLSPDADQTTSACHGTEELAFSLEIVHIGIYALPDSFHTKPGIAQGPQTTRPTGHHVASGYWMQACTSGARNEN